MLRPHSARYAFVDPRGGPAGAEEMQLASHPGGWRVTSRLELHGTAPSTCEVEWQLGPDLATHILNMWMTNEWGEEFTLEAAVTGNGLIASRSGPDGPTQVEMGWGAAVELDHVCACFTTITLARLGLASGARQRVASVFINPDDLVPQPLEQEYRALSATGMIQRMSPATGSRAAIVTLPGGVLRSYEGLFSLEPGWAFLD
ncbi:MAG: putative glycolipid-binding domain-containing protein [Candidatus Dormibacteria bacterium]